MLGLYTSSKITSKNFRNNFKLIYNNSLFSFSKIYWNENINKALINYKNVYPLDKYFDILINKNFVNNTKKNSKNQFLYIHKKYISNYDFKTKSISNRNENDPVYTRDNYDSDSYNSNNSFSKNFQVNKNIYHKKNYDSNSLNFKDNYNSFTSNKIDDNSSGPKLNSKNYYKDNIYNNIDKNNYKIQNKKESSINFSDSNDIDNYSNYDFTRSKYYIEKNLPETFKSKSEKLDLSIKDPNIKKIIKDEKTALSFKQMNFLQEIYTILDKLEINSPTSIQNIAIPKILEKKNIFFASQTGMGKTLAYVLPIINELKLQELQLNQRLTQPKRPRVLILAPSRELCQQIEEVIKLFVYDLPLVVESFYVGKSFGTEKKYTLKGVDILISTPDRFKNHWGKNNVYITQITHLVVDELDTFLDAGYADFIFDLSQKLLNKDKNISWIGLNERSSEKYKEGETPEDINFNENYEEKRKKDYFLNENSNMQTENIKEDNHLDLVNEADDNNKNLENSNVSSSIFNNTSIKSMKKPKEFMKSQLIFISTTLTKSIERFLDSIFAEEIHRKQLSHSGESNFVKIIDKSTNHNLSNIKHEFLQVTDFDKFPTLLKILIDNKKILKQNFSIILFVNSIICARKTELYLAENGFETSCLHGEIPPLRRKFELEKFKKRKSKILVTTDLIARGLDFPFVYLVINFDFPNNVSDYIHRAGRTGRAGRKGFVISFFRKFNIDLIEEIKNSNRNNTPLQTEGSMFLKKNKENFISGQSSFNKRLTYGLVNKSLKIRSNRSSESEKLSVMQKLKLRKERIDKMKANMIKERKERIQILDKKYNRKNRDTNKKNTYGNRWAKRK